MAADERDACFADINAWLRGEGLIKAWRDELYGLDFALRHGLVTDGTLAEAARRLRLTQG